MISAVSIKAFPTNIFPSDDITSADPVASRCILPIAEVSGMMHRVATGLRRL